MLRCEEDMGGGRLEDEKDKRQTIGSGKDYQGGEEVACSTSPLTTGKRGS